MTVIMLDTMYGNLQQLRCVKEWKECKSSPSHSHSEEPQSRCLYRVHMGTCSLTAHGHGDVCDRESQRLDHANVRQAEPTVLRLICREAAETTNGPQCLCPLGLCLYDPDPFVNSLFFASPRESNADTPTNPPPHGARSDERAQTGEIPIMTAILLCRAQASRVCCWCPQQPSRTRKQPPFYNFIEEEEEAHEQFQINDANK